MKFRDLCAALCLCGLIAASPPASAGGDTVCEDSVPTTDLARNPGYQRCLDWLSGRFADGTADLTRINAGFGLGQWRRLGLSSETPGFGPFSANPVGLTSGSLFLDTARTDLFVVGLQAINEMVFYLFDYTGRPPTNRIVFDTLGIDSSLSTGQELQVAALYVPAASPPPSGGVPEPASWALTLAGLCALGALTRNRAA